MIEYFYHFDYPRADLLPDPPSPEAVSATTGSKLGLDEHAKVFAMATKYKIPELQYVATAKFRAVINKHSIPGDLAHTANLVYTSTPEDVAQLRSIVAAKIANYIKKGEVTKQWEYEFRNTPGLAYVLFKLHTGLKLCTCGHMAMPLRNGDCTDCGFVSTVCHDCQENNGDGWCPYCAEDQ